MHATLFRFLPKIWWKQCRNFPPRSIACAVFLTYVLVNHVDKCKTKSFLQSAASEPQQTLVSFLSDLWNIPVRSDFGASRYQTLHVFYSWNKLQLEWCLQLQTSPHCAFRCPAEQPDLPALAFTLIYMRLKCRRAITQPELSLLLWFCQFKGHMDLVPSFSQ